MQSTMGFCAIALTAAGLLLAPANAQNQAPSTPPSTAPKSTTAPTVGGQGSTMGASIRLISRPPFAHSAGSHIGIPAKSGWA